MIFVYLSIDNMNLIIATFLVALVIVSCWKEEKLKEYLLIMELCELATSFELLAYILFYTNF